MSILIRGMEMPKSCLDCPFMVSREGDECILQSEEANVNFENWEQMKAGCPLFPVPPHGDLIDADALPRKDVYDQHMREYGYSQYVIDAAPTIIPAEEEKNK